MYKSAEQIAYEVIDRIHQYDLEKQAGFWGGLKSIGGGLAKHWDTAVDAGKGLLNNAVDAGKGLLTKFKSAPAAQSIGNRLEQAASNPRPLPEGMRVVHRGERSYYDDVAKWVDGGKQGPAPVKPPVQAAPQQSIAPTPDNVWRPDYSKAQPETWETPIVPRNGPTAKLLEDQHFARIMSRGIE